MVLGIVLIIHAAAVFGFEFPKGIEMPSSGAPSGFTPPKFPSPKEMMDRRLTGFHDHGENPFGEMFPRRPSAVVQPFSQGFRFPFSSTASEPTKEDDLQVGSNPFMKNIPSPSNIFPTDRCFDPFGNSQKDENENRDSEKEAQQQQQLGEGQQDCKGRARECEPVKENQIADHRMRRTEQRCKPQRRYAFVPKDCRQPVWSRC